MMVFKDIKLSFVYTKKSILRIPSFVDFTLTKPVLYTDIYQYLLYQILTFVANDGNDICFILSLFCVHELSRKPL